MATWKNQYVRLNEYSRPGLKLKGVRKLIVHWTANLGGTAANHFKYFDSTIVAAKRYASAHIFVDKTEALCIVPLDEVAYAANDGTYRGVAELKPNANFYSISVELCVEKDGSFHADTLARAAQVFAELCKTYKLDPTNDIVRHYDVTKKNCPAPWVSDVKKFEAFKASVKAVMSPIVEAKSRANVIAVEKSALIGRKLTIKTDKLWYYNTPRWDVKGGEGHTGDRFIITEELTVNGARMVKCHDGKYRTADPAHVDISPKPSDWPYRVVIDGITHAQAAEIVNEIHAKYKNAKAEGQAK